MSDLTLIDRLGDGLQFDETTKKLTLDLNDLNNIIIGNEDYGLDVSGMTEANKDEYSSRILWALLLRSISKQPENNNDETVGVYITNQGKRTIIRNGVSQFGFQLLVSAYQNDTIGNNLDPDAIGA